MLSVKMVGKNLLNTKKCRKNFLKKWPKTFQKQEIQLETKIVAKFKKEKNQGESERFCVTNCVFPLYSSMDGKFAK